VRRASALVAAAALCGATPAAAGPPSYGIVHVPASRGTPLAQLGQELYAANCSMCHGPEGEGITRPGSTSAHRGSGPPLRGVGELAASFYLRTGYMPLAKPGDQPTRSRVLFSERELRALVTFVGSLGGGPAIPTPHAGRGSVSAGQLLFTDHCAGCHQVVAEGGVVTGARVPPLLNASPVEIAEAVRTGPFVMPKFSKRDISGRQLDSIIAYVQYAKHPQDPGGWSIGRLGPVPEGMVTWFIAAAALVATCLLLGKRFRRSEG
jgi:ubiquinol-cytochrome c reductase cytochrome c subunit